MLDDIKKTLWASADKLRANMDAAEYKHLVLGLIFVKYISDAFVARQSDLKTRLRDPADELFYGDAADEDIAAELEDRDYYTSENVFWVPEGARWEALRAAAPQPDIGKRIDDALSLIEADNPKLKGILDKRFARAQLPDGKLGELVNLISTIGFGDDPSKARDILGQVYEYFLGMFASAEGKRGGQFYTPASIVKTLVAVLSPSKGQIYDPCCGSSGMFVQSEKFIEDHGGKLGDVSIYGQEANPTTWRLAAMNLVIRGMDYNLGKEPADTFTRNQHPDLRADFCLANPPFNISDWWHASLDGDARWVYGTPPQGNANYAWLQHILHHLKPTGRAGIVLANGSMSSSQNSEGQIRAAMVEDDVVEVMVALPGQLFFNTQIPACLWFLAKQKKRQGEVLFIDARKLATMISRVQSELTDEVIERISQTVAAWRSGTDNYHDIAGFCRSVPLAEIAQHGHVLTPGRYVGAEEVDDDDEAFADKMQTLTAKLGEQMTKGAELDALIRQKLGGWGMSFEISPGFKIAECQHFCDRVADGTHDSPKEAPVGKRLVTSKNVKSGRLELDSAYLISAEDFESINKRSKVDQWDLLLTMIGTVGEVCLVTEFEPDFAIKNVALLKCGDELKAKWLYYFLRSPQGQKLIEERKKGSTQQYVSLTELRRLPISYPDDPSVMRRIVEDLTSIDERITLLRETNTTLEAIAQALFKSWFVDFDPVHAKMQGRAPEGMDEATAVLFPNSFEESELGDVPKGWSVGTVGDFARLKKGTVNPSSQPDSVFQHFSLPAFDDGQSPVIEFGTSIKSNKTPVPEDAVLLSKLNPHIPRIWLPVSAGRNAVCSTEFLAFQPTGVGSRELIYCLFSSPDFISRLQQLVTGTSNSHQRIKPDQVALMTSFVPIASIANAFEKLMRPVFERIHANRQKVITLSAIRDTLLPRLISGQLSLAEAATETI